MDVHSRWLGSSVFGFYTWLKDVCFTDIKETMFWHGQLGTKFRTSEPHRRVLA